MLKLEDLALVLPEEYSDRLCTAFSNADVTLSGIGVLSVPPEFSFVITRCPMSSALAS